MIGWTIKENEALDRLITRAWIEVKQEVTTSGLTGFDLTDDERRFLKFDNPDIDRIDRRVVQRRLKQDGKDFEEVRAAIVKKAKDAIFKAVVAANTDPPSDAVH